MGEFKSVYMGEFKSVYIRETPCSLKIYVLCPEWK